MLSAMLDRSLNYPPSHFKISRTDGYNLRDASQLTPSAISSRADTLQRLFRPLSCPGDEHESGCSRWHKGNETPPQRCDWLESPAKLSKRSRTRSKPRAVEGCRTFCVASMYVSGLAASPSIKAEPMSLSDSGSSPFISVHTLMHSSIQPALAHWFKTPQSRLLGNATPASMARLNFSRVPVAEPAFNSLHADRSGRTTLSVRCGRYEHHNSAHIRCGMIKHKIYSSVTKACLQHPTESNGKTNETIKYPKEGIAGLFSTCAIAVQ